MKPSQMVRVMVLAAFGVLPGAAALAERTLGVEIWTRQGDDAVYQPGDRLEVKARTSDDAYLLVYEIDADGNVVLLYPYRGSRGLVEGRATHLVPPERSNVDLVVQDPVGQCYVVAIASREPFVDLPWYLRPYDVQAQSIGYEGDPDEEEGITSEGRIVGDPYVAMERIRRRVLENPDDEDAFATAYTSYYVHHEVRYPRYLCYDCHRPNYWSWWSDFDPYYASCSVFDFRVNAGWGWGPSYWFGSVPYYYYVHRHDCPPHWRHRFGSAWYSSWDGWRRWCSTWGGPLVRYKSDPPAGYVPPSRYRDASRRTRPPGFLSTQVIKGRSGLRVPGTIGAQRRTSEEPGSRGTDGRGSWRTRGTIDKPGAVRRPGREITPRPAERELRTLDGRRRGQRLPMSPRPRELGVSDRARDGRPREIGASDRARDERPRELGTPDRARDERPRDAGSWNRPTRRSLDLGPRAERPPRSEGSLDRPQRAERPRPRFEAPRAGRPREARPPAEAREDHPRAERSHQPPAERPRLERPPDRPPSPPPARSEPGHDRGVGHWGGRGGRGNR
ncbi:MAG TPA: DUF4384 domain-containing protein [Candidatus Limnocylindria bacterium]|nr:DUF4384 domain-containing protein [Candidatus Limnocylindria bacterium]